MTKQEKDAEERKKLLFLFQAASRIKREEVAPKFEEWRKHYTYKIAYGGRGAGAKTTSAFSLSVQFGEYPQYFGEKVNVMVVREVQSTIDISSYTTILKMLKKLQYRGWYVTKTYIENEKNGSRFMFRGLNDVVADNFRSLEDIDILIVEEAHNIGYKAWETVLPSMRKKGCEVWVLFNRVLELDPCYDLFVKHERPNSCILHLLPGNIDNPWFDDSELPEKRDADYARDADEAMHIWEGLPRVVGNKCAISRVAIHEAMKREIPEEGVDEIGVDVARFGSDSSQIFRRKGLKLVKHKSLKGFDTVAVAGAVWDMADHRRDIPIKIDEGYNPGVIDLLKEWGARVIPINFGGTPSDKDRFTSIADEMWFTVPINELSIPEGVVDEPERLVIELSGRQFKYDSRGRKKIEPKEDYKKRSNGVSPDMADGFLLCYYQGKNSTFDEGTINAMKARRQNR